MGNSCPSYGIATQRPSAPKEQTMSGKAGQPRKAPEEKDGQFSSMLLRAFFYTVAICVVAEVAVITYMLVQLGSAGASSKFGMTVAVGDDVKTLLPWHFAGLQAAMKMCGGFYHNQHATEYFEAQRPLFEAAAAEYHVHRYFSTLEVPKEISWHNMIHARIIAFAQLQLSEGRDDFRVEKDRCAMYEFFRRNNIPICKVLGSWRDQNQMLQSFSNGSFSSAVPTWPVFLKACHLTQSSSKGTRIIKSAEHLSQIMSEDLPAWVGEKWAFRAHDFDRPWVKEGDQLTDALVPSFLVQGPFEQPGHPWEAHGRMAVGLLEMRVEVLWGRAYLAQLDGCILFFRDGQVEDYSTYLGFLKIPMLNTEKTRWIIEQGYMDCVWKLAEKTAKATATENIRIDMFLKHGDPAGCTVNENSLSSGLLYWGHDDYLAQTWAGPHASKKYKILESDKPVYELTPEDTSS